MLTAQCETRNAQRVKVSQAVILFALRIAHCAFAVDASASQQFQTGLAYERLGRFDEAYTALQLAHVLDPKDAQKALALGILACRLGRIEVAQRALEKAISIDSNSSAAYFHLALIYEKTSAIERALDAWTRFLVLGQDELLKTMAKKHLQYLESLGNS